MQQEIRSREAEVKRVGIDAASISSMQLSQVQSQAGVSVLKKTMDAQTQAAQKLLAGFDQVGQTIAQAANEPGKGMLFDARA